MAINKTEIGKFAMEAMDSLFAEYTAEELESLTIEDMLLTISVRRDIVSPEGKTDGASGTYIYCNNPRRYIQKGLLSDALDMARGS